jgi:hypothetical protein
MAFENPDRILGASQARRTALAAADSAVLATFKTAHGAAFDCEDRSAILLWNKYDTAARTGSVRVVWFDSTDAFVGFTDAENLNATPKDDGNLSRPFVSPQVLVPNLGFPKFRLFLESLSGGTVDLFAATAP